MAIEVFNRYENKYRLTQQQFLQLTSRLSDTMELDEHNRDQATYPVLNLYYDTKQSDVIRTSLMKPKYKEKLRVRSYGVTDANPYVYVEIKKKVAGLVNKRRSAMKPQEAIDFLRTGQLPTVEDYMNPQVLQEIQYMMQCQVLQPAVFLAYERRAYFGIGQHDLRISFDRRIITRRSDLHLDSPVYGQQLLGEEEWLMEVKVAQSIPLWLCRLLSDYEIYPASFSKYGTEYRMQLAERLTETLPAPHPALEPQPNRALWQAKSI